MSVTTSYLVLIYANSEPQPNAKYSSAASVAYFQTAPATSALRQSALPGSFHSKVEILPTDVSNCNEVHTK